MLKYHINGIKLISFLMLLSITSASYADEVFPSHCKPLVIDKNLLELSAIRPKLVMIHNLSAGGVWLTSFAHTSDSEPNWNNYLQSGHWSALALDKKLFKIICIESQPGHEHQVPCATLIVACEWSDIQLPQHVAGTAWVGVDMDLPALIAHIGSVGFIIIHFKSAR